MTDNTSKVDILESGEDTELMEKSPSPVTKWLVAAGMFVGLSALATIWQQARQISANENTTKITSQPSSSTSSLTSSLTPIPTPIPARIQTKGTVTVALITGEVGTVTYLISVKKDSTYQITVSNAIQDTFAKTTSLGLALDPASVRKKVLSQVKSITNSISLEPSKDLLKGYTEHKKALKIEAKPISK